MIECKKTGLFIDGQQYTDNDEIILTVSWESDLDQDDMPVVYKSYGIRKNEEGKVYLFEEVSSAYEGFDGVRQQIIRGKDFKTLYEYILEKFEEEKDDITCLPMVNDGRYIQNVENLSEMEDEINDTPNYPGTSEEIKEMVLFESSLKALWRQNLGPLVAYIGGVYLAD